MPELSTLRPKDFDCGFHSCCCRDANLATRMAQRITHWIFNVKAPRSIPAADIFFHIVKIGAFSGREEIALGPLGKEVELSLEDGLKFALCEQKYR